jgi:hypothetical protein
VTSGGDVGRSLAGVRARIARAAANAGRDAADVTLVVVSKSVAVERIRAACAAGASDLGENRAQELVAKAAALGAATTGGGPRWHFVGRLQRNKVRALAPYVSLWQSVDRADLAEEIGRRVPGARVLVQVNLAAEPQKGGCDPHAVPALVDRCRDLGCTVEGLMTVPPAHEDPVPWFRALRRLTDETGLATCSMGMSGDFEEAIAAGATMVRVGSAVFGPRPPDPDARR